jgi:hypothetical protein
MKNADSPCITYADDERLVSLITAAKERVVFLAPGVSPEVANALAGAWKRLGRQSVSVIVDADAEVCRFGYGTIEGLKILSEAANNLETLVCQQPGVRIGLLIADQTTLIYSPAPLIIEESSNRPERPNAIELSAPPQDVVHDLGLGDNPFTERVVGTEVTRDEDIKAVEEDLKNDPPVRFDLARRVRVFTSKFQFVELEMSGCYISRKKVQIPADLLGAVKDKQLQSRLQTHFNLVNDQKLEVADGKRKLTEDTLRDKRQEIYKRFLTSLKGYGSVVLRTHKEKLIEAVAELQAEVAIFQKGIKAAMQTHIVENVNQLVVELAPRLKENPPDHYLKVHGPYISEDHIKKLLADELNSAFGKATNLIQEMKVSLVFKDVAYESLTDENFLKVAREAMPTVESLHDEYEAARAVAQENLN